MGGAGDLISFSHISSSWVEIILHTELQLPRLPGSETVSFRLNPIFILFLFFWGGGDTIFLDISSSWVERSLHAKFQLPRMPRSGSSMVGDKKTKQKTKKTVELEATLAPAEAGVGAVAKADQ